MSSDRDYQLQPYQASESDFYHREKSVVAEINTRSPMTCTDDDTVVIGAQRGFESDRMYD